MLRKILPVLLLTVICALVASAVAFGARQLPLLVATGNEMKLSEEPGTLRCVGGFPTGLPAPLCSPGTTKIIIRGMRGTATYENLAGTAAAMFDGQNLIEANCNLNANYRGQCWGSFQWTIPGKKGTWEGMYSGEFDLPSFVATYRATGHGNGGELEGLKLSLHAIYPGGSPLGTFVATIGEDR